MTTDAKPRTVDPDPQVDILDVAKNYVRRCPTHDMMLPEYGCNCPGEHRGVMSELMHEVQHLRTRLAQTTDEINRLHRSEPVTEHAVKMAGGGMHIRNGAPHIERVFPLEKLIESQSVFGHVWRRTVIVVDDWREVERGDGEDLGSTVDEILDRQFDVGAGQHWPDCRKAGCDGCMGPPAGMEESDRG